MELNANVTSESLCEAIFPAQGKSAHVKHVFEDARHYLRRRGVDILFRRDAVKSIAERLSWESLLDIGCGDGTISLPLLTPGKKLTLLDLSASMTQLALENTPPALKQQVAIRNEDFITAEVERASIDLIITVGVLAHVDSLERFLSKIRSTLRPGGYLILEFTDCRHPVGRIGSFFDRLKESIAPARYPTNKLSREQVLETSATNRLRVLSTFRYSRLPVPLLPRLLSIRLQHRVAKNIFGDTQKNTFASFGNEYICLLQAED